MRLRYIIAFILLAFPCLSLAQGKKNIFTLQSEAVAAVKVQPSTFTKDDTYKLDIPQTVYGLAVSGKVALLDSGNSMVRVTAQCSDGIEYLIYEVFPDLADSWTFDITDMAMESAVLKEDKLTHLNITIINAEFVLTEVKYATEPAHISKEELMKAQEGLIVETLNRNLEKRNKLWRADRTSVSNLTYEQKKATFGNPVPNYSGFEYYRGGIFVVPGYKPEPKRQAKSGSSDNFVPEWDWRNRHGKNWVTPAKDQTNRCGACTAFSTMGVLESYINLYYNNLLNKDLSEQQLVSCVEDSVCKQGLSPYKAYDYLTTHYIVDESCYPYAAVDGDCSVCYNPYDIYRIEGFSSINSISDYKRKIHHAPISMCFSFFDGYYQWGHALMMIGYKKITAGDLIHIWMGGRDDTIRVPIGHEYIGEDALVFKNSYGLSWGENGIGYTLADWNITYKRYAITGNIVSHALSDNDIVITDEDGDGYYFWGIGPRPANLPIWIPQEPDGDDSDPTKGPLDSLGFTRPLSSPGGTNTYIWSNTQWSYLNGCHTNVYVMPGATLTITGNACLNPGGHIYVYNNASLVIDGGMLHRADIKVYYGGHLEVKNGAVLIKLSDDTLQVDEGATMQWTNGRMIIE